MVAGRGARCAVLGPWGMGHGAGGVKKGTGIRRLEARDDVRSPQRLGPTERPEPGSLTSDLWPPPPFACWPPVVAPSPRPAHRRSTIRNQGADKNSFGSFLVPHLASPSGSGICWPSPNLSQRERDREVAVIFRPLLIERTSRRHQNERVPVELCVPFSAPAPKPGLAMAKTHIRKLKT